MSIIRAISAASLATTNRVVPVNLTTTRQSRTMNNTDQLNETNETSIIDENYQAQPSIVVDQFESSRTTVNFQNNSSQSVAGASLATEELQVSLENVNKPVIVDPDEERSNDKGDNQEAPNKTLEASTDDDDDDGARAGQEESRSEESEKLNDQLDRRAIFIGSKGAEKLKNLANPAGFVTDELKRFKNHHRSKSNAGKQKKPKRRKKLGKIRKKSNHQLLNQSQTRQATSTTASYGNLLKSNEGQQQLRQHQQSNGSSMLNKDKFSNALKQHFPNIANPALNLSSAVQKLIMNKLNPTNANQQNNNSGGHPKANAGLPSLGDSAAASTHHQSSLSGAYLPGEASWDSAEDSFPASFTQMASLASAAPPVSTGKQMIPVEIIGLDPEVTNSILYGSNDMLNIMNPQQPAQQAQQQQQQFNDHSQQPMVSTSDLRGSAMMPFQGPKASSVLHVHHFHVQKKPHQLMKQPNNLQFNHAEQQQQIYVDEQQNRFRDLPISADQSGQQQQPQAPSQGKISQQQVFVNDKGELVYLAVENQPEQQQQGEAADGQQGSANDTGQEANWSQPLRATQEQEAQQQQGGDPASSSNSQQLQQPGAEPATSSADGNDNANGQSFSIIGARPRPTSGGGTSADEKQQLLMISYKPVNQTTTEAQAPSAYNDGQESKASLVSTKNMLAGGQPLLKSTSLLLKSPTLSNQHSSSLPDLTLMPIQTDGGNRLSVRDKLSASANDKAKLFEQAKQLQMSHQFDPDRVPSSSNNHLTPLIANQMMRLQLTRQQPGSLAFNNLAGADWLLNGGDETFPLLNGYGNSPKALANPYNNSLTSLQNPYLPTNNRPAQSLIESLALFKRLQLAGKRLQQEQHHLMMQQGAMIGPSGGRLNALINNQHQQAANDDHRMAALIQNELKLANNHKNFSDHFQQQQQHPNNLRLPSNKFEFTQASDLSPPKFFKNFSTNENFVQNTNGYKNNKATGVFLNGQKQSQPHHSIDPSDEGTASNSFGDLEENNGLSSLATALIFIVSLLTLTTIAVLMIYRHKRRFIGKCNANAPGRTRLNLTQRTKHFMRSNFVRPADDSTAIKSINLNLHEAGSGGTKLLSTNNVSDSNESTTGASNSKTYSERYSVNNKTFCQQGNLSTFNSSKPALNLIDKCKFSSNNDRKCANDGKSSTPADIKTLNTRLQKQSYIKSLISDNLSAVNNAKLASKSCSNNIPEQPVNSVSSSTMTAYLNVRHNKPADLVKSKPRSNLDDAHRRLRSANKPDSDLSHGGYMSSMKNPSSIGATTGPTTGSYISSDKISLSNESNIKVLAPSNRMSTIHSISSNSGDSTNQQDNVLKSPKVSKKVSSVHHGFKLNCAPPAPKHLMAQHSSINGPDDYRNNKTSRQQMDVTQMDKL